MLGEVTVFATENNMTQHISRMNSSKGSPERNA